MAGNYVAVCHCSACILGNDLVFKREESGRNSGDVSANVKITTVGCLRRLNKTGVRSIILKCSVIIFMQLYV
jgi:hypothetical protein